MDIQNKRVIVTGSASGIGASAVKALVAAGAKVAALDLNDEAGRNVAAEASAKGPGVAHYFRCDVSQRAQVDDAFGAAVERIGGLDALVNIAGVERKSPAESITQDDWDLMFDVNARGTLNTNQAAFVHLKERGGHIVNFASAAGVMGVPGLAHYSAAGGDGLVDARRSLADHRSGRLEHAAGDRRIHVLRRPATRSAHR